VVVAVVGKAEDDMMLDDADNVEEVNADTSTAVDGVRVELAL